MYFSNAMLNFVIIVMLYFNVYRFLEGKEIFKKYLKIIIAILIVIFTIVTLFSYELTSLCYLVIFLGSIMILFKNSIYEKIFISSFIYIVEGINVALAITIIFLFKDVKSLMGIFGVIALFIILGILLFITQILLFNVFMKRSLKIIFSRLKYKIYLAIMNVILFLVANLPGILQKYGLFKNKDIPRIFLLFSLLCIGLIICFYYVIKFNIYKKELFKKYKEKTLELESIVQDVEEKSLLDDKKARIIHDIKNHNMILKSLIEKNNFKEALNYIDEFNEKISKVERKDITKNLILNTILSNKREVAIKKEIDIKIKCFVPKDIKISAFDLTTVFSNLIDNAIEENERNNKGNKFIKIKINLENEMLFFYIENPVDKFRGLNKHLLETRKNKKENHGLGLKNVKDVIKKYDGIIEFNAENSIFIAKGYFNISS